MSPGEIKISKTILLEREFPKLGKLSKGTLNITPLEPEKCHYKGCRYCPKLDRVEKITSHTTGKKYTVSQKVDCKSNNLVYIFTCTKCSQQYVGETKCTLGERVSEHYKDIRYTKHCTPHGSLKIPHLWVDTAGNHHTP